MGCVVKKLHEPVAGLKYAAVSITPTSSAIAEAIHWFRVTPSSCAKRSAASLIERGSFKGWGALRDR
jgi:hypothetical protein